MRLILFIFIFVYRSSVLNSQKITEKYGDLNRTLTVNVSRKAEFIISYKYNQTVDDNTYLRAYVDAHVPQGQSVLIILKDNDDQVKHIKLTNFNNDTSVKAERTICPILNLLGKDNIHRRILMVDVSTESMEYIRVDITIRYFYNLQLELNKARNFSITEMSPIYFLYTFEDDFQQVNVVVTSTNKTCMIFSVQKAMCPVYDSVESIKFKGIYQSVTNSGSITVQKSSTDMTPDRYFIVFVITYNEAECGQKWISINKGNDHIQRSKSISVSVEKVLNYNKYILPVFGMVAFYLSFFVAALAISFIYNHLCNKTIIIEVLPGCSSELVDPPAANTDNGNDYPIYRSVKGYDTFTSVSDLNRSVSRDRLLESEDGSFDSVSDAITDPNVYRLNRSLHVSDLSTKDSTVQDRKYFLYLWYLIIISVFYALPVVQLVITYQKVVRTTGNEDVCYYNFKCTRPFYIFTAFNNIISNVGYVLLGVLYILITWRRNALYNECKFCLKIQNKKQGIPQYNGLFYAMGVALTMEGILSACYHICPSNNNFQFDTAYMYILACLCMIKIYQTRHPDVNASAHSFYMTMSFIIFVGVIGVVYNILLFWIFFTISYIVICFMLTLEVYYMGRWNLDTGIPYRVYHLIVNDRWRIFIPTYRRRMLFLLFLNVLNISFALFGVIKKQNDFASFFLAIFMFNLLIYFGFYIVMKMKHCEHFHALPILYVVIAIFCWGFAIYCFINHTTDWQVSPAESRELNQQCIFLEFYDLHDVWHFLSSMSMFFSFLALQNLDDSLFNVDRDKIPVF